MGRCEMIRTKRRSRSGGLMVRVGQGRMTEYLECSSCDVENFGEMVWTCAQRSQTPLGNDVDNAAVIHEGKLSEQRAAETNSVTSDRQVGCLPVRLGFRKNMSVESHGKRGK